MANSLTKAIKATVKDLEVIKKDLITSHQTTMYEIGESLVFYTPLLTGLASSNWNVTSGGQDEMEREATFEGGKGLLSLTAMATQVKDLYQHPESTYYNPVEYIQDLENATSPKAPMGMVTPTLPKVENIWMDNLKIMGIIN